MTEYICTVLCTPRDAASCEHQILYGVSTQYIYLQSACALNHAPGSAHKSSNESYALRIGKYKSVLFMICLPSFPCIAAASRRSSRFVGRALLCTSRHSPCYLASSCIMKPGGSCYEAWHYVLSRVEVPKFMLQSGFEDGGTRPTSRCDPALGGSDDGRDLRARHGDLYLGLVA